MSGTPEVAELIEAAERAVHLLSNINTRNWSPEGRDVLDREIGRLTRAIRAAGPVNGR